MSNGEYTFKLSAFWMWSLIILTAVTASSGVFYAVQVIKPADVYRKAVTIEHKVDELQETLDRILQSQHDNRGG